MLKKRFFKTKDDCEVTFEYTANSATQVAVVGEFNGWKPLPMQKAKAAGSPFRLKIRLPRDEQFQFRYFIDQERWVNDEEADSYVPNDFGGRNSVVSTGDGT